MNIKYTVYEDATGRILRSGTGPEDAALDQAETGQSVIIGEAGNDETQFVEIIDGNYVMTDRPVVADLNNVPEGTVVYVNSENQGTTPAGDPVVEVEADVAGTYQVRLEPPFPYQIYTEDVVIP